MGELRRARSFRNAREKSSSRNNSAANSRCSSPVPESANKQGQEVSFSIMKSFGSRKGWKIMPDDGQQNIDSSTLQNVVSLIKDMELKGVCSSRTDKHQNTLIRKCEIRLIYLNFLLG